MPRQQPGRADQLAHEDRARIAMARGTLVLDENVRALEPALRGRNIRIVVPPAGMSDADIKHVVLSNRILVTRNSFDFRADASSYDYGIIALDTLSFIDPSPDPRTNRTAQAISQALQKHGLWSLRYGFVVDLRDDGTSTFTPLTE